MPARPQLNTWTLGRPFLSLAHNIKDGADEYIPTHTELDIQGNPLAIHDARGSEGLDRAAAIGHRGNTVMEYRVRRAGEIIAPGYDMAGRQLYQNSMDAGERRVLPNVAGDPIRAWDSRGHTLTTRYDILQRPTHRYVQPSEEEYRHSPLYPVRIAAPGYLAEWTIYGDGEEIDLTEEDAMRAANLRGQVYQQYDGAGVITNELFDFKGNLLESRRELLAEYRTQVNWADDPAREDETFTSRTTYDALDRPVQMVTPHNGETQPNVIQPIYNEANLLERVDVWLQRESVPDELLDPGTANLHPVTNINYDAKGQRTRIAYGNGATTTYDYDPRTFRLTTLETTRPGSFEDVPLLLADSNQLQTLRYTYDPVGNITRIANEALPVITYDGQEVEPVCRYTYDALYRLIQAQGREHAEQNSYQPQASRDNYRNYPFTRGPNASDLQALRNYTEIYEYDTVGNILAMIHQAGSGAWNRRYDCADDNNRLLRTSLPGDDDGEFSKAISTTTVAA